MSRNKSNCFTGANATPLGPRNKAIGAKRSFSSTEKESRASPPRQQPPVLSTNAALGLAAAQAAAAKLAKRVAANNMAEQQPPPPQPQPNMAPMAPPPTVPSFAPSGVRGRPRKKRSRWGTPELRTDIPGIPTVMPANLTPIQQRAYILQLQIEDINRKLKSGTLGIPSKPEDRSPSPEPIYGSDGKRLNTREYRTRKRLEEDRHKYIMEMQDINPEFKPPTDYKPPMQRISERVMIPQDDNPLINFVGLLIGPRGNTLKRIEKETTCKIMIRGKGSVKEGKIGRKDGQPLPGEDEPLHALVSSGTLDSVQKAVKEIQKIIKEGIEQPEGQNDLRKLQLMELARLNGTLRDETMPREREWLRPENQNITNTTICQKCGGRGHLEQDCIAPRPSDSLNIDEHATGGGVDRAKMDSEYMSLMAELGQGPPPAPPSAGGNMGGPRPPSQGAQAPPWMSRGSGGTAGNRFNNNSSSNGLYGNEDPSAYNAGGDNRGGKWNQSNNMGYGGGYPNQSYGNGQNNYGAGGQGNYGNGNNFGGAQGNYGNNGYGQQNYGSGNMAWQQQQNPMGGPPMPFDSMAPPPPPPPSAPQQPPPPSDDIPSGKGPDGPPGMGSQTGASGNWQGGNNYGMWNQGGINQPPMPSGPGPMPPPPPSGGSGSNPHGMGYGMMGMVGGYGMQPAPPPPPPQS